jgi:hypothetical protein
MTFLLRIGRGFRVQISALGQAIPDWSSSVPSGKFRECHFKLSFDAFLPHPFQFTTQINRENIKESKR